MHAVTNDIIDVNGQVATGRSFLIDLILGAGHENPLRIVAYYDEEYRHDAEGWKISRSKIEFVWTADTGRVSSEEPMQKVSGT
jgi:hypothetical protein